MASPVRRGHFFSSDSFRPGMSGFQFSAHCFRRRHHRHQCRLYLGPAARFQTAIRINPELIRRKPTRGRFQEQGHFVVGLGRETSP